MEKNYNFNFLMPLKGVATKTFLFEDGAWTLKKNYRAGKYFKGFEIPVADLKSAYAILETNQEHPAFMIHGGIIDGTDKNNMIRRKRSDHKDGLKPTLVDRYLKIFCLDIDGYKNPDIEKFIIDHLPEEFHSADYIYQYSASYGLTTNKLNCHLFFWLNKSVHNLDIKTWIKAYNKNKGWGNIIDDSILNCAQPIYTQKRICEGKDDPIKNFIGYVEKSGELFWLPEEINEPGGSYKPISIKKNYDLAAGVEKILTSENYHEELNRLALSLINKKVPARTVKDMLEGAMNAAKRDLTDNKRLEDWQERFDDIGRSVDSAIEIVENPTIEEILLWIEKAEVLEVKADFAKKALNLDPMDKTTMINQLVSKIGFGISIIKKTIKIAEDMEQREKIKKAKEAKTAERESRGIHELEATIENSGEIAEKVCSILAESEKKPKIFVMGKSLVSVGIDHPTTIRQCHQLTNLGKNYPKMPIVQIYKKPFSSLIDRMKKDIALVNINGEIVEPGFHLLNVIGEARDNKFKTLTGIVEAPFINNKWELVKKEGYNKKTGLYTFLHRKLKITKMDPKKAYKYLAYEVFDEFPFSSELDRVTAVAALMTAVQRPSIIDSTGFPGFGIISPIQSSGKTTLAQLISYAIFNRPVAATGWSDNEEELGKHLLAILQEGHSCILFDNIKQGAVVESAKLSSAISNDEFSGRKLGENKTIKVPSSAIWLFTGNNIAFSGDFATRIYPININPKMEDPNTRSFNRYDIGQWAIDNRKKIISAILSIVISGKGMEPIAGNTRFKDWDIYIRRPLYKVSGIDVNTAVKQNQENDPIRLAKRNLVHQLYDVFGKKKFTTKEIIQSAFGSFEVGDTELGDALENISTRKDQSKNTRSIGRFLIGMVDTIFSGLILKSTQSNIIYWNIENLKEK